jgi:DNA polymerase-3 subunit alpha
MPEHFTHLHLHSDHSLLDGAITIDKLISFGKEHKLQALAITDHGNIFAAVKFFQQAKKAGIKPILGIEAYFTEDIKIKNAENKYYHLIILVENKTGYKNLCKLISHSYQDGFYFKPRIDYELLEKYNEGLIVTSACLGGHIPSLLMNNEYEKAEERVDWFLRVFGSDRFYLEVQPEDQEEQKILNERIYKLSEKKRVQLVATGDCHYVHANDREAHEVMLSIQTHHKITDPDRFTFGSCRVHMRTCDEMLEIFKEHPDAVWNTGKIADRCQFDFETGKLFFPQCALPEGETEASYFKKLSEDGLKKLEREERLNKERLNEYKERLDREVSLITNMGFVGYFLVVSDFIVWAKENGIPVGPGRGSAAGSLVAWALQITDIDPLEYNLLFERFLNPERVTMPDIDIDFCIEGRDKVIQYVRDTYGNDKVCQIITFGTMMAKGVIKDVARVLGFPFDDANMITDLIGDQLKITLKEAAENEPRLKELLETNTKVAHLFDIAVKLEGLTRHASKHAAGIVISPDPIDEVLPVYIPPKSTDLVTQYAMTELESLGFLKIDFLGLKNLTLIKQAIELIKKNHSVLIDSIKIPLDDALTFSLLSKGKTSGVFQLESDGLRDVLRRLQPEKFEDIIAVNALYRPGPLGSGMVDDFIERRHGRAVITYLFPELEPVLQETYGVIVYQEQVIKIASVIGGYSLGEADILRRAMGKKKAEVMAEQRSIFLDKSRANGFDPAKAGELFDLIAYFAGYGFNKSHSAAYALIAYQTAYLKAHYPAEFMACLISLEAGNPEHMALYIDEAKDMKIPVLRPDVNESGPVFDARNGSIRFGLTGIKNLGGASIDDMVREREKRPFSSLSDFCSRVDLRTCNKRVIENLICAGAFDGLPGYRSQKYDELARVIDHALQKKKERETGQLGLFSLPVQDTENYDDYVFASKEEWTDKIKLEKEKEVIGLYISAQPLDAYAEHVKQLLLTPLHKIPQLLPIDQKEPQVTVYGIIKSSKIIMTKKGARMAFVTIEDPSGKAEIIIFPKVFALCEQLLQEHSVFLIKGTVDLGNPKIKAEQIMPFDTFIQDYACVSRVEIRLPKDYTLIQAEALKKILVPGPVPLDIVLMETTQSIRIKSKQKILVGVAFLQACQEASFAVRLMW